MLGLGFSIGWERRKMLVYHFLGPKLLAGVWRLLKPACLVEKRMDVGSFRPHLIRVAVRCNEEAQGLI